MIHHQFLARHCNIETHVKGAPLMFMLVRNVDHHSAAHDFRVERFKLFHFLANVSLHASEWGTSLVVICSCNFMTISSDVYVATPIVKKQDRTFTMWAQISI